MFRTNNHIIGVSGAPSFEWTTGLTLGNPLEFINNAPGGAVSPNNYDALRIGIDSKGLMAISIDPDAINAAVARGETHMELRLARGGENNGSAEVYYEYNGKPHTQINTVWGGNDDLMYVNRVELDTVEAYTEALFKISISGIYIVSVMFTGAP